MAVADNVGVNILTLLPKDSLPPRLLHSKLRIVQLDSVSMAIEQPCLRIDHRQAIQIQIEVNLHAIRCDLDAVHHLAWPSIFPTNESLLFLHNFEQYKLNGFRCQL